MTREELQRILVALDKCCEQTNLMYTTIELSVDDWEQNLINQCNSLNDNLDDIIDIISDWAATYSATYSDFICQQEDNEVISYEIVFENYLCMQTDVTTTTTTAAVTTTTTINPLQVDWRISFEDYKCAQWDDPSAPAEKSANIVVFSADYESFICQQEDNPDVTTTTTTFSGTTTTSTTVTPGLVQWTGLYDDYICQQEDNPDITTTTTTQGQVIETVAFEIEFKDYKCMQTDVTTTTTTPAVTTTTTTAALTTTTTTTSQACGTTITGTQTFPSTYAIALGAGLGEVTLTISTIAVPDKFTVEFDGAIVINTGYRGLLPYQTALYQVLADNGAAPELIQSISQTTFTFQKTTATQVAIVRVYAPLAESAWSFTLSCPDITRVTTTTTTSGEGFTGTYDNFICQEEGTADTTTTTAAVTTTTTQAVLVPETITCGATVHTGTQAYPYVYIVIGMGTGVGWVTLTYDSVDIPDRYVVEMDGDVMIDTGYVGDTELQSVLDDALASYGQPASAIQGTGSGTATFYKTSATTFAIVKVFAPVPETEWSFAISCPDGATTTTTTTPITTTTTTAAVTTTTTVAITTTTTNAPPVSGDDTITNTRTSCSMTVTLAPSDFPYTDAEGDTLEYIKITGFALAGSGTLKYNGVDVDVDQVLQVVGGASGSFIYSLIYTPDATVSDSYNDYIDFKVKTANNAGYY